ncbi:MAG: NrdH-redoxin [Chloroflexi bacterium]|nr:NrdH-redoxin [Chloroflexota bacterium]
MPSQEIFVYGTFWCPDCARAKKAFAAKDVEYTWIDISKDKESRNYVERVNGGARSVPTIVFPDGSTMVEPSTAELYKKFNELS